MQIDEDRKAIATAEKQKKKRTKKKENTSESTEDAQFDGRKLMKNDGDGITEGSSEKDNGVKSISDDKEKKEKKKKHKKKKKKDKDEGDNDESTTSSRQELLESDGDQDKGKKRKEKDGKFKFLPTEVNAEGKSSGNSSMKTKRAGSGSGETDTKKRKHGEQEEGVSTTVKSSKKAKKSAKDKACKSASGSADINPDDKTKRKSKSKRVSFSGDDEVFPFTKDDVGEKPEEGDEIQLVHGKRFSEEEDQLIRDAVESYVKTNQLGEDGIKMVLKAAKHPEVKGCWHEICAALPWRPLTSVRHRAHIIYERSEKRGFSDEEKEVIRKFHAEFGPQWKKLAEVLGKQRIHVKDAWRRIRLPNEKKGHWSQEEYQILFDLVNLDLRIKAFKEQKSENVMIREDISWEAISDKISTRTMSSCCHKWYDQLRSPLVARGVWTDSDDYRLLDALQKQDACNAEEVDWDSLLERRPGEICRLRWDEMVRHIGGHRERTFIEQVDVLTKRYCGDMLQYRFKHEEEIDDEE